ncbi:hypothetical protein RHSP_82734 [Rhizobium freirei PRF 81]|uniref:Uncharacterized protein n=1 Tax=Rhizobium freirei PRF 81 TaxID=363754 RepID=N6V5T1_9HYPH|nr:hypothetical protein [Rhizobium freirei]ENN88516.1 hypothetical protein RHSP_82734 [Rhizobium freirei PRF 81]
MDLLGAAITRDKKNLDVAEALSREHFAKFIPPAGQDPDEAKADYEARAFEEFLKSGYKKLKDPELAFVVETYSKIYIGYRFQFNITQTDDLGANINILSVLGNGKVNYPIGGSFEGKRASTNDTAQKDVLGELFTDRARIRVCNAIRKG